MLKIDKGDIIIKCHHVTMTIQFYVIYQISKLTLKIRLKGKINRTISIYLSVKTLLLYFE